MSHISFSALKTWTECPFKFKLTKVDNIAGFEGNHYTAFGTAVHNVCEQSLLNENLNQEEHFLESFMEELQKLPEHVSETLEQKVIDQMYPYFIGTGLLFMSMFVFIMIILLLNIKVYMCT